MGNYHISSIVCSSPSFDWNRANFWCNVYFLSKTGNMWGCFDLRNKPEAPPAPDLHLCSWAVRVWHLQAAYLYSSCFGKVKLGFGCSWEHPCFTHSCPVKKMLLALRVNRNEQIPPDSLSTRFFYNCFQLWYHMEFCCVLLSLLH